ncbi:hypothetical protein GCM10009834_27930 [Streptomonospora arabica]|uniref:Uncharacterized protein n=1 Tax=Streptomonospora halophila TaxID=427369 RepID=A0ABP9GBF7_9ACTN
MPLPHRPDGLPRNNPVNRRGPAGTPGNDVLTQTQSAQGRVSGSAGGSALDGDRIPLTSDSRSVIRIHTSLGRLQTLKGYRRIKKTQRELLSCISVPTSEG